MANEGKPVEVRISPDLDAVFSNFVLISNLQGEMILDFAEALPQMPTARIKARIIMTPINTKALMDALTKHIAKFEAKFGAIPTNDLTEQLFKGEGDG